MKALQIFSCLVFFNLIVFAQKTFVSNEDVFGTRVFVENKGQFNQIAKESVLKPIEQIKFAYENSGEHIFLQRIIKSIS